MIDLSGIDINVKKDVRVDLVDVPTYVVNKLCTAVKYYIQQNNLDALPIGEVDSMLALGGWLDGILKEMQK